MSETSAHLGHLSPSPLAGPLPAGTPANLAGALLLQTKFRPDPLALGRGGRDPALLTADRAGSTAQGAGVLDASLRPPGLGWESYGWDKATAPRPTATQDQITRMEEAIVWLLWISDINERTAVWVMAHRLPRSRIARKMRCARWTIYRWEREGMIRIARRCPFLIPNKPKPSCFLENRGAMLPPIARPRPR